MVAEQIVGEVVRSVGGWAIRDAMRSIAVEFAAGLPSADLLHDRIVELLRSGTVTLHCLEAGDLEFGDSSQPELPLSNAQKIVREFRIRGIQKFFYRGQDLELVVAADKDSRSDLDDYDILSEAETQKILQTVTRDPTTPLFRRDIYSDAAKAAVASRPPDPSAQVVLLRKRKVFLQERKAGPVMTPSQLRKMAPSRGSRAPVDEQTWIELELVWCDDAAVQDITYRLTSGADSSKHEGTYQSIVRIDDAPQGSFEFWLPEWDSAMAMR